MPIMKLVKKNYKKIAIDTVIFIYFFEYHDKYRKFTDKLLKELNDDNIEVYTSIITLIETSIKPYREDDYLLINIFKEAFTGDTKIKTCMIDENIALKSAMLRAEYNIATPDAIQMATAIVNKCEVFLTNDKALKKLNNEIEVLLIDDIV